MSEYLQEDKNLLKIFYYILKNKAFIFKPLFIRILLKQDSNSFTGFYWFGEDSQSSQWCFRLKDFSSLNKIPYLKKEMSRCHQLISLLNTQV